MRIYRQRSTSLFRRRRRTGCLSLTVLVGLLIGMLALSWNWLGTRITSLINPTASVTLRSPQAAFDAGDLDAAVATAAQIVAQDPTRSDALEVLVRALIYRSYSEYDRTADREQALAFTQAALGQRPDDPLLMALHAFALQANGQPAPATQVANRALNQDPDLPLARAALALAYLQVGNRDAALRHAREALADAIARDDPARLDALRAVALSLADLGRYDDAMTTLEEAIAINNKLLALYFEQASFAVRIGDADRATAAYFSVLAFDSDNVKAHLRMCALSSLLAERQTAVEYCEYVVNNAPTWDEGWYTLGREYFLQGRFAAAQDALHRCTTLQTINGTPLEQRTFECWYLQGQAAEKLGDCDALLPLYAEYQAMAAAAPLPQTWTYPPEGPPMCVSPGAAPP